MDDTVPVEAAHGETAQFVCPVCDKPFRTKASLGSHKAFRHPGEANLKDQAKPRRDRQPAARPTASKPRRARRNLKADLEVIYNVAADVFVVPRDPICGAVVKMQIPAIAEAEDAWAASSPRVQAAFERFLSGSGLAAVILAHAPIIVVVLQHHGPQRDLYFPPPPMAEPMTNGVPEGEPTWGNGGPVASGYEPASADRAR